jgi:hypothetical protein
MGPEILLTLLGLPLGLLTNLTYEKIKKFSEEIQIIPLQDLFIKIFFESLDRHADPESKEVKKFKKTIKKKQTEFLEIFKTRANDYQGFLLAMQNNTFIDAVAKDMVDGFKVVGDLNDKMTVIIGDCLEHYKP